MSVTGGIPGPPPGNLFTLDNKAFAFSRIDNTVTLDDTVAWTVTNSRVFTHSFHIHDVMFKIVARNGNPAAVGAWEQGWKDVAYLPTNESVTFVAKFDDYADTSHPFMYHCHFANHEDEGMMGQFIVKPPPTPVNVLSVSPTSVTLDAPAGSSRSVNVTSNVAWTARAVQSWLNIDKASGTGNAAITIMAQENTSVTPRTAMLTLTSGTLVATVRVVQSGVGPTLVLSSSTLNVPSIPKNTNSIEVRSNVSWTAASDQSWCTPDPSTGTGVTTVGLSIDTNTTASERTAHVTFLAQNVPVQTLTVVQSAGLSSVD
ncbi:MAG: multicopper oxidase domain-containing protein, partial [Candidatus Kapaibacterium sp.]